MANKPILFSPAMVRAIINGRKTQTRRVLKLLPPDDADHVYAWHPPIEAKGDWAEGGLWADQHMKGEPGETGYKGGYKRYIGPLQYAPGDLLYVREPWKAMTMWDDTAPGKMPKYVLNHLHFVADGDCCDLRKQSARYRQGMHLPRSASRITLKVTDVRPQRLQGISDADALEEGVECAIAPIAGTDIDIDGQYWPGGPKRMFRELWDSINAERKGGIYAWDKNPWVLATTFKPIFRNVDKMDKIVKQVAR